MKTKLLFFFFMISSLIFGQTIELEKEYLNQTIRSGQLSQEGLKNIKEAWDAIILDNRYPELPYNEITKKIEYILIDSFPGLNKEEIYRRVKEWIAINYGSINSVIHYEDFKSGKIIVKGFFNLYIDDILNNFWGNPKEIIRYLKCYHTVVFTIKEAKMKAEYANIEYEYESSYYTTSSLYIPPRKNSYNILELYPITSSDIETWPSRISTLKNTTIEINLVQKSIINYVRSIRQDSNF